MPSGAVSGLQGLHSGSPTRQTAGIDNIVKDRYSKRAVFYQLPGLSFYRPKMRLPFDTHVSAPLQGLDLQSQGGLSAT